MGADAVLMHVVPILGGLVAIVMYAAQIKAAYTASRQRSLGVSASLRRRVRGGGAVRAAAVHAMHRLHRDPRFSQPLACAHLQRRPSNPRRADAPAHTARTPEAPNTCGVYTPQSLDPIPWAVTFCSTACWCAHGFASPDAFMFLPNIPGLTVALYTSAIGVSLARAAHAAHHAGHHLHATPLILGLAVLSAFVLTHARAGA